MKEQGESSEVERGPTQQLPRGQPGSAGEDKDEHVEGHALMEGGKLIEKHLLGRLSTFGSDFLRKHRLELGRGEVESPTVAGSVGRSGGRVERHQRIDLSCPDRLQYELTRIFPTV